MPESLKKFLLPTTLVFVSLSISLLIAEQIFRWHAFGANAFSYSMMKSLRHIGKSGLLRSSEHVDINWELKPGLDTIYKLHPVKTNSYGFRDKEYSLEKPEDTYRVAVLGDSFTMPEGVPHEESYHSRLEEKLSAENPARDFEFLNFAVPGYSFPQYIATIKHRALRFQPDLIWISFCAANDSGKPNLEALTRPYKVKSPGNGFFEGFFFDHVGNIYKRFYRWAKNRYPGYKTDSKYIDGQFAELADISRSAEVPVVVVYVDNKAASRDFDVVKAASEKYGFDFINATTEFSPKISEDHIIYKTDMHPNGAAHALMAKAILADLETRKEGELAVFRSSKKSLS